MTTITCIKKILNEVCSFPVQGSENFHHGGEHDDVQADVVLVTTWYAGHRKLTDMVGSI